MAFFGDPLEELIDQLEHALPDDSGRDRNSVGAWQRDFLEVQQATDIILYGSEEQRRALETDPSFRRFRQKFAGAEVEGQAEQNPQAPTVRTASEARPHSWRRDR